MKYESKKRYNCSSINRNFFIMVLSSNTKVLGFMSIIKIYSYSLSVSHHFFNVNVMGKEAGN